MDPSSLALLRSYGPRDYRDAEDRPRAMIVVVNDTRRDGELAPEREIFQASADAMTSILLDPDPTVSALVREWIDGRIRKIVKRARGAAWERTNQAGLPFAEGECGDARVRVFAPIPVDEQPEQLRKLQVSGLQATNLDSAIVDGARLEIIFDDRLGMSTGKRVAQLGHAVQLFLMYGELDHVEDWLGSGATVVATAAQVLDEHADVIVRDAGFTEVPEGAMTCVAVFRG